MTLTTISGLPNPVQQETQENNVAENMEIDDAPAAPSLAQVNRSLSQNGKNLRTTFSDGDTVNDGGLRWRRWMSFDAVATELVKLHECSLTMAQVPWEELDPGFFLTKDGHKVTHVGQGVFVQDNTHPVDPDSRVNPKTITTQETREFAMLCLETSLNATKKNLVLGTGQPRIGKTREALSYTLQELLWRGEAVMRVGYKDNAAFLFLPQEDGSYKVWREKAKSWSNSDIVDDDDMFVLIDPPESGDYDRAASCHVIEYCSNNEERHLRNATKDGEVLIMDMPNYSEILCMSSTLFDEEKFRIAGVTEPPGALERRCNLVGCLPGIVFDGHEFMKRLRMIKRNAQRECKNSTFGGLIYFYKGGSIGTQKHDAAVMSRFFFVRPAKHDRGDANTSLNAATSFYIRNELRKHLADLTGAQAFTIEDICVMFLEGGSWNGQPQPTREVVCGASLDDTTTKIKELPADGTKFVRASNCYPILDFAVTETQWFNAKVGESTPKVSLSAFVTIMKKLGFATVSPANVLVLVDATKKISLTLIRNNADKKCTFDTKLAKSYKDMSVDQIQAVFEEVVTLNYLDTGTWAPPHKDTNDALSHVFDFRMTLVESGLAVYKDQLNTVGS